MQFWKNNSGNLKQFACNHSNSYAYQRIVQMTAKDGGSADFAEASYRSDSLAFSQQLHPCEIFGLRINNENNQE